MKNQLAVFLLLSFSAINAGAMPWISDLGDGRYKNPVLYADYSDPDPVRVGADFYMVASSFNAMPGIPVLHSKDLVNWTIIGHVYDKLPFEKFDKPVHGQGSWAPSIRYHDGLFYVYFCTPHEGLFVATAKNPAGPWKLQQMVAVELWEDPAPFWDDDGNAYLVRGKVRADILYLHKMSKDGKKLLDNGTIIYHNVQEQPTIEGPKMLKKDGYYYVLAPAGGVATGWQVALRSKNIYGPYETRNVLQQGNTQINGPHQGGLLELDSGEWWFLHFQDRDLYGRVVHLQPVRWQDGWPLMGQDIDNDGIGEPVPEWKKPDVGKIYPVAFPQTSDEFNEDTLGRQWQWHANPQPQWYSLNRKKRGHMRLYATQNITQSGNLWFVPSLLLQKFPAPELSALTRITFRPSAINDKSGLVVMGQEWAYLALYKTDEDVRLGMFTGLYDREKDGTVEVESLPAEPAGKNEYSYYLKVEVAEGGKCRFLYSLDGRKFTPIGKVFQAKKGMWIGAKLGIFSLNPNVIESRGYADFDWFRID